MLIWDRYRELDTEGQIETKRLARALGTESPRVEFVGFSKEMQNDKVVAVIAHYIGNSFVTIKNSEGHLDIFCSCPDHTKNSRVCKHILWVIAPPEVWERIHNTTPFTTAWNDTQKELPAWEVVEKELIGIEMTMAPSTKRTHENYRQVIVDALSRWQKPLIENVAARIFRGPTIAFGASGTSKTTIAGMALLESGCQTYYSLDMGRDVTGVALTGFRTNSGDAVKGVLTSAFWAAHDAWLLGSPPIGLQLDEMQRTAPEAWGALACLNTWEATRALAKRHLWPKDKPYEDFYFLSAPYLGSEMDVVVPKRYLGVIFTTNKPQSPWPEMIIGRFTGGAQRIRYPYEILKEIELHPTIAKFVTDRWKISEQLEENAGIPTLPFRLNLLLEATGPDDRGIVEKYLELLSIFSPDIYVALSAEWKALRL